MGKKMAGTNEFAFFRCKSICTGGGPESGRKKFEKCLPAGTGAKIYFSRDLIFDAKTRKFRTKITPQLETRNHLATFDPLTLPMDVTHCLLRIRTAMRARSPCPRHKGTPRIIPNHQPPVDMITIRK